MKAQQNLSETVAELQDRQSLAQTKGPRLAAVQREISRLNAEQELDGADHAKRIAKLESERDELVAWLDTWPDVKAELNRRIDEAQAAVTEEEQDQRMATLQTLLEAEPELRQRFASDMATFAETAQELRKLIADKEAIVNASFEHGHPIRDKAGDLMMPTIPNAAVNWWSGAAARMAKESLN